MGIGDLNVTKDVLTYEILITHINIEIAIELFHMLKELKRTISNANIDMVQPIKILDHNINVVNEFIEKFNNEPFVEFNGSEICLN